VGIWFLEREWDDIVTGVKSFHNPYGGSSQNRSRDLSADGARSEQLCFRPNALTCVNRGTVSIEERFDVSFIAALALREKQIQQNYRPIIAIHKWFARRPGTLFRGLILSEFGNRPLDQAFFERSDFSGRAIADPFMGGGTPLIEANRVGCDVTGLDINPMSTWIVREQIEHLDVEAYLEAAARLVGQLREQVGEYYQTDCPLYGDAGVPVKYFLWVKTHRCEACSRRFDLFPGYLLAEDVRHPKNVLICPVCGELNEARDRERPGRCQACSEILKREGPARRNRCACPHCDRINTYPRSELGPPEHRMFAIEYHNPARRGIHKGRFFKRLDQHDLARFEAAKERFTSLQAQFVPPATIPAGDETDRLHRWGYRRYRDLFNARQLLGLELSCRLIKDAGQGRISRALATNLSDLLRYQNMLCRYDAMALKSLDIFSVHGFPVGLVQCESNLFGIGNEKGGNIGSGGWSNIIDKYAKGKRWCDDPFEVCFDRGRSIIVPIFGEWVGERLNGEKTRNVTIRCADATNVMLPEGTLDAVFTDPPYFGNVQYGELMDFCYVWLRRLVGNQFDGFDRESTRSPRELTGNLTQGKGIVHFAEGISSVFRKMSRALKLGAPLVFTYHHNRLEAYYAIGVAILDAGLTCSASLPCPAEMGGSVHIHGTRSSIVDTVFVCRSSGTTRRQWLFDHKDRLAGIVAEDLRKLREAGVKSRPGDTRCIIYGHLTRMAIWNLRRNWDVERPTKHRLEAFHQAVSSLGDVQATMDALHPLEPTPVSS
jgi:putative DNA methylase